MGCDKTRSFLVFVKLVYSPNYSGHKKIHNSSIIPELVEKSREIHKTDPRVLADIERFTQDIGSNESVEATDLTTNLVNLLIRYLEEEDDLDLEEFKKLMES